MIKVGTDFSGIGSPEQALKNLNIEHDELLMLKVWCIQEPKLRENKNLTFAEFGILFKDQKLANTESIRRSRQKIQQEIPSLRGKNYKKRNNHQEEIKNQLKQHEINKSDQKGH